MKRLQILKQQLSNNTIDLIKPQVKLISISSLTPSTIKLLTINAPNLNSLTDSLINELNIALEFLDSDHSTKVIVITGTGKSFAAGVDIKNFSTQTYQQRYLKTSIDALVSLHYTIKKPMIAAVNGYCFGGGLELALMCDLIYCADTASLSFPEIKLGLFPGAGGTQKLVRLLGYQKACEYILTGKVIDLQVAVSSGLINGIVKPEELIKHAENVAREMAQFSMLALVAAKTAMKNALEVGMRQGLVTEKYLFDPLFNTTDTKHGIQAFINKKKPEFIDN